MSFVEALKVTAYIAVLDICCSPAKIRCSTVWHTIVDGFNAFHIMTDAVMKKALINEFLLCL
jgi:hypothetical protein